MSSHVTFLYISSKPSNIFLDSASFIIGFSYSYSFDGLDDMYKNVTCDDMSQIGISIRSVIIDSVTKRLIKDNKNLIVVNIGFCTYHLNHQIFF
jgi:hypothetical protein